MKPKKIFLIICIFLLTKVLTFVALKYFPYQGPLSSYINNYIDNKPLSNLNFKITIDASKNIHLKDFHYKNDKYEITADEIDIFYNLFSLAFLEIDKLIVKHPVIKLFPSEEQNEFSVGDLPFKYFANFHFFDLETIKLILSNGDFILVDNVHYDSSVKTNNFSLNRFAHFAPTPLIRDFNLTGNIQKYRKDINANLTLTDITNFLKIDFSGKLNYSNNSGSLNINANEIEFFKSKFEPSYISPKYLGIFSNTTGKCSFSSFINFSDSKQTSGLNLKVDNITTQISSSLLVGMNGDINLSNLLPLQTDQTQTLTVREIMNPVGLNNGKITFYFEDGNLKIDQANFAFGEGDFSIKKSVIDMSDSSKTKIDAFISKVKIEDLVPLSKNEFFAIGIVNGRLTLGIRNNNLIIKNGYLSSPDNGILKYKPADASLSSNQSVKFMLDALQNFNYKILKSDIERTTDERTLVKLEIFGNNPDIYDGKTFKIKVNLDADILDISRKTLDAYNMSETFMKRKK